MPYVEKEIRIVILGKTGVGKSTLGNLMVGHKAFKTNPGFQSDTKICLSKVVEYEGQEIQIVDTPGFCDTEMDEQNLNLELKKCLVITSPGIHAVLFTIRIGRFTKEDLEVLKRFLDMFGEPIIDHVVVIFTGKDDLDREEDTFEDAKKTMSPELKKVMADCKERYVVLCAHAMDSREGNMKEILKLTRQVVSANKGNCYTNDMFRDIEIEMRKIEEKKLKALIEQNKEQHEKERHEMETVFLEEIEMLKLSKEESDRRLREELSNFEAKYKYDMQKMARNLIRNGFAKAAIGVSTTTIGAFVGNETFQVAGGIIGTFFFGPIGGVIGATAAAAVGTAVGAYVGSKLGQASVPDPKYEQETKHKTDQTDTSTVQRVVP